MTRPAGRRTPELLHPHTAATLRKLYIAQWKQDWPHDDRYLKQLWDEAKEFDRLEDRRSECLTAMRESDTTISPEVLA